MGWANCGTDSRGRRIGYAFSAKCDHRGCKTRIDRGLGYACGGMHGTSIGCEGYFCEEHRSGRYDPGEERWTSFCAECVAALDETRSDEMTDALLAIAKGGSAEAAAEAIEVLERWGEWPAWSAITQKTVRSTLVSHGKALADQTKSQPHD